MSRVPARSASAGNSWALAAAFGLTACVFPSERDDTVFLTIDAPSALVQPGGTLLLTGHAWLRDGTDTVALPAVTLRWSSLDPGVATLTQNTGNTALLTGVGSGRTQVELVAADFESAEPGVLGIRVANAVEIDSVRPTSVSYGDLVTLYGVGLGEVSRVALGPADLVANPATRAGSPRGIGQLSLWVPYPAVSDRIVAVNTQGIAVPSNEIVEVGTGDLYDTLTAEPTLGLDGPPAFGTDTLFHNPALALAPGEAVDRYRFVRTDTARAITLIASTSLSPVGAFDPVVSADSLTGDDFPGTEETGSGWAVGLAGQHCRGHPIDLPRPVPAPTRVIRALQAPNAAEFHLSVFGDATGAYSVTAVDGYVLTDPQIGPDRFEENDYCDAADLNAADPAKRIDPATSFQETLTIDNPYEADWFRFSVPAGEFSESQLLTVSVTPDAGVGGASDIDLVLLDGGANVEAEAHSPGSTELLRAEVSGDQYVLVQDQGGVPTRYRLCITIGTHCSAP